MTADQPSPAAVPAAPMAPEHPADPDAVLSDAPEGENTSEDSPSGNSGGQLSEGPSSLSTAETSGGGADAVPDTHG